MDPLSQSLRRIHIEVRTSHQVESYAPMGARVPRDRSMFMLFTLLEGSLFFELDAAYAGERTLRVETGDLGLVLGGRSYVVRDAPSSALVDPRELPPHPTRSGLVRHGRGSARRTALRSVVFDLHAGAAAPLFAALAPVLRIRAGDGARAGRLLATFESLFAELADEGPGAFALTERWAEALLIELVRAHLPADNDALAEPAIAAALALIHAEPGGPWTVDSLAERVSLSRTVFAVHFAACVGEPPFRYLTRLRMELATHLLQATDLPLHAIARRAGYADVAAFHKAFTRWAGRRPGELRAGRTNGQRPRT